MILKKLITSILKVKKFRWNKESTGPVGRLSTDGLADFLDVYKLELGSSTNSETLKNYLKMLMYHIATSPMLLGFS
jgi:hypothetical protein